jgi:ABC-type methionine transport system ATPase subunit
MTFDKDDLIMDIGKVKNQWAVKALFIAPPDPLAQKLVGSLPATEKSADSKATEESNK